MDFFARLECPHRHSANEGISRPGLYDGCLWEHGSDDINQLPTIFDGELVHHHCNLKALQRSDSPSLFPLVFHICLHVLGTNFRLVLADLILKPFLLCGRCGLLSLLFAGGEGGAALYQKVMVFGLHVGGPASLPRRCLRSEPHQVVSATAEKVAEEHLRRTVGREGLIFLTENTGLGHSQLICQILLAHICLLA